MLRLKLSRLSHGPAMPVPSLLPADALPSAPAFGDALAGARVCPQTLTWLALRRSTSTRLLSEPGPDPEQIRSLLRVAARAPDHGKLTPWRFVVLTGDARRSYGEKLAAIAISRNPQMDEAGLKVERERFLRAPCVIAVVSRAGDHAKIPVWEQHLSAGAVCFALLLAGQAMGLAGCWLTEWPAYDDAARAALGLAAAERIAGFIYLGSPGEAPRERERPDLDGIVTYYEV